MTQTITKQKVQITTQNQRKYDRLNHRWYTPIQNITRTIHNVQETPEHDNHTWRTGEVKFSGKTWTCRQSYGTRGWRVCKGYDTVVS